MAKKDLFASVDFAPTDGSTSVDLQGFQSSAFLVTAGATPGSLTLEESSDDSTFTSISTDNLRVVDSEGKDQEYDGSALDANATVVVRYVGELQFIRGASAGTDTLEVLRGMPARCAVPQTFTAS